MPDMPFPSESYHPSSLPDHDREFIGGEDLTAFAQALDAPENVEAEPDATTSLSSTFITALNDWRPIRQRVRPRPGRTPSANRKDESREGFVYSLVKWPLLFSVGAWIVVLTVGYSLTRLYVWFYERIVAWRGPPERLRATLRSADTYHDWIRAATALDEHLGNDDWRQTDEYAYYDSATVKTVTQDIARARRQAEAAEHHRATGRPESGPVEALRAFVEGCVKANFAGTENAHLYSETYYGTKRLVQAFVDELERSLDFLLRTEQLSMSEKRTLFRQVQPNFGRTALCLSGGASYAYYHFGVVKALLDASLLPDVVTGTSGGALVAALVATRTDDELRRLLVPALASKITACQDDFRTWFRRFRHTGARFDALDWARHCSWFTRGSLTFREAYQRTGRILNVTCVPSDPYSPTILCNPQTSPDCVIWSAVLASAAVPGILSPVVLMTKRADGSLAPYSFGHKWKDGSLRTDIPLKALQLRLNVHFSIVSQVNPHVNLFVFSSRGQVGRPVTHRRGRGWRGGFLISALEQSIKLDLNKWLRVLRQLELLPRPLGQDWSQVLLQRFSGTITIWPKSRPSDMYYILSDPTPERLARMLRSGQLATFPKLKFISNRIKIERLLDQGRRMTRAAANGGLPGEHHPDLVEQGSGPDDRIPDRSWSTRPTLARRSSSSLSIMPLPASARTERSSQLDRRRPASPSSVVRRRRRWWPLSSSTTAVPTAIDLDEKHGDIGDVVHRRHRSHSSSSFSSSSSSSTSPPPSHSPSPSSSPLRRPNDNKYSSPRPASGRTHRSASVISEISRQSRVFLDDDDSSATSTDDDDDVDDEDGGMTMIDTESDEDHLDNATTGGPCAITTTND